MSATQILSTLLLIAAQSAPALDTPLDEAFQKDVLVIEATRPACYRFDVYLAFERAQLARGLMRVRDLPATSGMLFVYPAVDYHTMWMKNTLIPLDIAFAREDGRIANVVRDAEPQSLQSIASAEPVSYVLELNAGVTERLGIDEHSRILWGPIFEQ